MLVKNLFFVLTLAATGLAQEIDNDDIPNQCRAVCASIVTLANDCDRAHDDDRAELNCICQASGANSQIPLCEACVSQFDDDGRDNDVNDLLRSCSFTTTTYNSAAPSASVTVVSGSASLNTPGVSPATTTAASSGATTGTSSGPSTTTSGTGTTLVVAEATTNAAPAPTLGVFGVGLGALGFAMGMM